MLLFLLLSVCVPIPSPHASAVIPGVKDICSVCSCTTVEHILYINCERNTIYRPGQLRPPTSDFYHLNFQSNLLVALLPHTFSNFTRAISLQLGNNELQSIQAGAFKGLGSLKQLHLNNNELRLLRANIFQGLENLEYLQADFNLIKSIERGAFNKMHRLKVLILNDNLLASLPDNVFRFASLTHLDLRGNRIQNIPYLGVLEHIGRIVEFQLEDNPWNCSCDLHSLTAWLENMPYYLFVGEAMCETPSSLYGKLLKETSKEELCAEPSESDPPETRVQSPVYSEHVQVTPGVSRRPTAGHLNDSSPIPQSGIVSERSSHGGGRNYSQIASFETRMAPWVPCPLPCLCKSHSSDLGLSINCQQKDLEHPSELFPRPRNAKKLHLSNNDISHLRATDFGGFEGLDLLHLGNNKIAWVETGVFRNLSNLRRLYLNGNQLEKLNQEMFVGLLNLQYLYLEYNMIRELLAGTFDSMLNLQLLYLHNNLLKSLPAYAFAGVPLARLNLKNNHFMYLPVSGVLDQLRSLTQVDLEGNPWDCTCDLVALKLWLERLNQGTLVREVKCESPVKFANLDLRSLKSELLCPRLLNKPVHLDTSPKPATTSKGTPLNLSKSPPGGPVPLSILILSILVVLILTVFVAFCLLVFVLQRHKKSNSKHEVIGSQECNSMQLHLKKNEQRSAKGQDLSGEMFIPQTIDMSKSHAGSLSGSEQGIKYADPQGQTIFLRNINEKEKDSQLSETKKRLSTIDELDELLPPRDSHLFYRNVVECKQEINSIGISGFELHYPEKLQEKKLKKSLLGGNHTKILVEQRKGEYFELKAKLQASPDYLQVLEEQTALNQM